MAPTYKLLYFPLTANGELPRLTLALAGAEWENKFPDWKAEKDTTPFGKLPVLVINDNGKETHLAQSQAITRYLAAKYQLGPQDDLHRELASAVADTFVDFKQKLDPIIWHLKGEALDNAKKELQDTTAPTLIKYLTRILQQNGSKGIYYGDKIGIPELATYFYLRYTAKHVPEAFTRENAPELFKVHDLVQNNERIKAYSASEKNLENKQ
ncbi:hypothetical protein RI367_000219 [Sorochytrium milnesiophthora]